MARKTVKVNIPTSRPDELIKLGQDILAKHQALGTSSPLDDDKMTKLGAVLAIAAPQNKAAKDADKAAQTARQLRDNAMGIADGQNAQIKGTGLNLITYARDELLLDSDGAEETLEGYGFTVVVGSAKTPQRAVKKPA